MCRLMVLANETVYWDLSMMVNCWSKTYYLIHFDNPIPPEWTLTLRHRAQSLCPDLGKSAAVKNSKKPWHGWWKKFQTECASMVVSPGCTVSDTGSSRSPTSCPDILPFNFGFFWAVRKVGEVWVEDDNVRPLLRRITEGYIEGEGGEGLCHLRYSYHIESE